MKHFKFSSFALLFLILSSLISGCYRNEEVSASQVGLKLKDNAIVEVVGPGRYTDGAGGWERWATFTRINTTNITTSWTDPSLLTRDKQPIGLTMSLTFARKRDSESIKNLYTNYNIEAQDDAALVALVLSRVPGIAKEISTKYTLDQMLGIAEGAQSLGREALAQEVTSLLQAELAQLNVNLVTVEIADIAVSDSYLAALNAKNEATIQQEVAKQETILVNERLKQEQAQTLIELEKADRANKVNELTAKAYEESPQLFQLEMLKRTADILNKGDLVVYVPEGTTVTSVLTQGSTVLPTP